jgi:hypothetical protein
MGLFNRKKKIRGSRNVTKAKFLYWYFISSTIFGLLYVISTIFTGWPMFYFLTPVYALLAYAICKYFYNNWTLIMLYVSDIQQGKLLLYLNKHTHFSDEHKIKVVNWVYLKRRCIRHEDHEKIMLKVYEGKELSKEEKKLIKYKSVFCPQQVRDGINEAILVDALIYAHVNIQVLDDGLRDLMNLSDEHILAFSLDREMDRCRVDKYKKYIEKGEKIANKLKEADDTI